MLVAASQAKTATGSGVHTSAGEGDASSGGVIVLRAANAAVAGSSGRLSFSSGSAVGGDSASIHAGSGASSLGRGGVVKLIVGSGTSQSGPLILCAGTSLTSTGGNCAKLRGQARRLAVAPQ